MAWSIGRSHRAPQGDDGFILLESLVAISLISIILAALGTFTVQTVQATSDLRARQAATQLATSTMANLSAVPATDLIAGHDLSSVNTQFNTALASAPALVVSSLGSMVRAVDTAATTAGSGATATVPTVAVPQTLNNVVYSISTYLGTCVVVTGSADCVASATGLTYLRAVVAVTWPNRRCSANLCAYVTSTLVNTDADPVFNTNKAVPPVTPAVQDPGNQVSTVGGAVSLQLAAVSGTGVPPLTWSLSSGTLPTGLTLSASGLISGTPTVRAAATSFTVMVTDAFGRTGTDTSTWTVVGPPTVTTPSAQTTSRGAAVNLAVASTCPNSPCAFALTNAPAGLSINAGTGVITGAPTTVGTYSTVTITVTDAAAVAVTTPAFTWRVTAAGPTTGNPGTVGVTVGKAYSIPIPYTCPIATCTITLNGGFPGAALTTTDPSPAAPTQFTAPGTVDTTGTTNLSIGKTATQSSYAFSGDASRAVDGNTDGVYNDNSVSHTDNTQAQPWWQVDLGAASLVRAVRIWNRTDCCDTRLSNFYVFTSQTSMTGRTAAQLLADPAVTEQLVSGLNGQPSITIPAQSSARYVRVQLSGTDYLSLAEVQVLGTVDTGTSITVGASSGTVYATGVLPASAVPSGTSKLYTPSLTSTDFTGTSATSATGSWTAFTPPTVGSPGTQTMSVKTSPSVPIPYTCPHVSCTLTLAGTVPGLGLSATSGGTTANSTTSLAVAGTSGTAYVGGLVDATAVPSGSTKVFTPAVTITDSDLITATASGSWTVDKMPHVTNPGSQAIEPGQNMNLQMAATCPNNGASAACTNWAASVVVAGNSTVYPVTISSTGAITYNGAPAGTYTITVTVTDSASKTDTTTFTLVVADFTLSIPTQTTTKPVSGTKTVTLDVSSLVRPLASGYTYTMSGAPAWLTIDAKTGILTATIATNSASNPSITVTVTSTVSSTSTVSATFAWNLT